MKLEFSWQIFEKYSNIKFRENLSSGSRDVPCGQKKDTDRYDKALFAILQTCLKMIPVCWRYSSHRVFLFAAPQCETGALCLINHIHWVDNAYEKWILLNKICVQYSCKLCITGKSRGKFFFFLNIHHVNNEWTRTKERLVGYERLNAEIKKYKNVPQLKRNWTIQMHIRKQA